jgi:hypothetical protein
MGKSFLIDKGKQKIVSPEAGGIRKDGKGKRPVLS